MSLKFNVDKLDVDKLLPVPADLIKLSHVVKNDVVKNDLDNSMIKTIEDKIATLRAKINEVKGEIPSTTNLATTAALTNVESKTPNVSDLVKKAAYDAKI